MNHKIGAICHMAVSVNLGPFLGVLVIRTLLFGVGIGPLFVGNPHIHGILPTRYMNHKPFEGAFSHPQG